MMMDVNETSNRGPSSFMRKNKREMKPKRRSTGGGCFFGANPKLIDWVLLVPFEQPKASIELSSYFSYLLSAPLYIS